MKLVKLFPFKIFSYNVYDHILPFPQLFPRNLHLPSLFHIFSLPLPTLCLCLSKNGKKIKVINNKNIQGKIQQKKILTNNKTKHGVNFVLANFLLLGPESALEWLVCPVTFHQRKLIFAFPSKFQLQLVSCLEAGFCGSFSFSLQGFWWFEFRKQCPLDTTRLIQL